MASRSLTIADLADPREAAFVAAIFELGGPQHGVEAAIRAGYATDESDARLIAAALLGHQRIARAITGEVKARFDVATSAAFDTMLAILQDPKAPASARLTAAESILNRSSLGPVPSRSVALTASVSIEDALAALDAEEAARGSGAGEVLDAEYSEVSPEG
jgi:hypothetical protein